MLQQTVSKLLSLAQFCKAAPPAGFATSKHLPLQWSTPSEFGKQARLLSSLAKRKTVAVALSGGVDSAVAALLAKRQGSVSSSRDLLLPECELLERWLGRMLIGTLLSQP